MIRAGIILLSLSDTENFAREYNSPPEVALLNSQPSVGRAPVSHTCLSRFGAIDMEINRTSNQL